MTEPRIEGVNNPTLDGTDPPAGAGIFFSHLMKMKPFLIVFDTISMPGNRYGFGRRAFVDMFVFADSRNQAEDRAIRYLYHAGWLKSAVLAAFERYGPPSGEDERWATAYRQAELQGVGFHVGVLPVDRQPGIQEGERL